MKKDLIKKNVLKSISTLLIVTLLVPCVSAFAETPKSENGSVNNVQLTDYENYINYSKNTDGFDFDVLPIKIQAETFVNTGSSTVVIDEYLGSNSNVIIMNDSSVASWNVNIPKDGLYCMRVAYAPVKGSSGSIEQTIKIDDKLLFKELKSVSYKRKYADDSEFLTDANGNDIKPGQTEVFAWNNIDIIDSAGYIQKPFLFKLKQGTRKISFESLKGEIAIDYIELHKLENPITYQELKKEYEEKGYKSPENVDVEIIEAEKISSKSDTTIYPISDRSNSTTYPQDAFKVKLNTVGRDKWQQAGQLAEWTVDIKESGLYKIYPRFRQDLADGVFVSRKLYIDGEVICKEAQNIAFYYDNNWQTKALSTPNEEMEIYLEKGTRTIGLEVVLGDSGEILGRVENAMNKLNEIYREIIMITGADPDPYRDYELMNIIPDVIQEIGIQKEEFVSLIEDINNQAGTKGNYTSLLNKIVFNLKNMHEKPEKMADFLVNFKTNIGALGTWLLTARNQPLELDRIYISPANKKFIAKEDGFFTNLWFSFKCFLSTFVNDYSSLSQEQAQTKQLISVWIQTGRDQAQIIRRLIDTSFSKQHSNLGVDLQLVAPGTLLPSTLAGTGPDVSLNNPISDPINYAVRNANLELSKFPDFSEVAKRFHPSALAPYTFNGKTYALPETFTFPMFFYRTDIFEKLELKCPQTFDELMAILPVLQRNKLTMAFPRDIYGMAIMLYQNEGAFYEGNGIKTLLNSDKSLDTFEKFTELFTLYSVPVQMDFANRFRTGEVPCGIQDYSVYNQLTVFAPEIRGMWNFVPVPGIKRADGSIDHVSVGTGVNSMILKSTKNENASWEFVKWWLNKETQSTFAMEMESALGPAAKHPTANMDALLDMSWSSNEYKNLKAQFEDVRAIPEVPGGYYTTRILDFAFNRVYNNLENPAEVISEYMDVLNGELTRKRKEFGL